MVQRRLEAPGLLGWRTRLTGGVLTLPNVRRWARCPEPGKWVRLEVAIAKVGLKPGTVVSGLAFTQFGGTAYWDHAGVNTQTPQSGQVYDTLSAWVRGQRASGAADLPGPVQVAAKV